MTGISGIPDGPGRSPAAWLILRHNWVTYILVRLFCRSREQEISFLLYQYFRWLDDRIDDKLTPGKDKISFLAGERRRINDLYARPIVSAPDLPAQIVRYDRRHDNRLKPWIALMFEVFDFDARRAGRVVESRAIVEYSRRLAEAYTRLLVNFIEPRYPYAASDAQLAHACHILHMLRDYEIDLDLGYINIGHDEAARHGFKIGDTTGQGFRHWLDDRLAAIGASINTGLGLDFASGYFRCLSDNTGEPLATMEEARPW